jgi:capsular polysaccharide transport system permease protein
MTDDAPQQGQGQKRRSISIKKLKKLRSKARDNTIQPVEILTAAEPAFRRKRHTGLAVAFVAMVIIPAFAAAFYLFAIAADQYHSTVGFSVQKNDTSTPLDLIGGFTGLSGSAASDADILYEFIRSQKMVETIDAQFDLRTLYQKPGGDPLFTFPKDKPIEDLIEYWQRMVRIHYDSSTGLIELKVLAFTPEDATSITQAIFDESSRFINEISDIASDDIINHASEELDRSAARLKDARQKITEFRSRTQIVDPSADIQGQMGLLNTLQAQLAEALIDMDILEDTTRTGDTRLEQANKRIEVIRVRIAEERKNLGVGDATGREGSFATLVSEYERLVVDREFAENSYTSALAGYDVAQADARQQSRYLAAYIKPTLAQASQYPQRYVITALVALFAFLSWAIAALVYYSVRDRR